MGLVVIDRETVHDLLPMSECIALMRQAMTALSAGQTRQTLRQIIPLEDGAAFGVMPGASPQAMGAKVLTVFPGNFAKGMQSHQGFVALFEPEAGELVAMIHAGEVTAIRTAAASAAATDVLARPEASRLAILGYGEQAATHARAMACVRPLTGINLWGRSPDRAAVLGRALEAELGVAVTIAATVEAAVAGADIVCTVSAAREPILEGRWIAPGAHVNLVGSSVAAAREVDDDLVARGRLFADHRQGALAQGGEIVHAIAAGRIDPSHVLGEIGEVMSGAKTGRTGPDDVTLYKSLGAIVQDLFSGWHVYRRAVEEGRGATVPF